MADASTGREADEWKLSGGYVHDDILLTANLPESSVEGCRDLGLTSGDVLIATYPKSGTTWLQEIVYLIQNGADLEEARSRPIGERVPYVEVAIPGHTPNLVTLMSASPPRLMFTHLRPRWFQKDIHQARVKVIIGLRNPKDALVSYFHFYRLLKATNFTGDWDDFFKLIRDKNLIYGDVIDWAVDWWRLAELDNVHVVHYEDLKRDRFKEVSEIARFLGKANTLTIRQLEMVSEATSFQKMAANPSTNQTGARLVDKTGEGSFLRKGEVGDWRNYFSREQEEYIDRRVQEKAESVGIQFCFQ